MTNKRLSFLYSFYYIFGICYVKSEIVYTNNGALSGTVFTTASGRTVSAFLGIPYAQPPVDGYRFEEPRPVDDWEGVRTAHSFSPRCIQYTTHKVSKDPIKGEEDCLYLNIFTPILSNTSKLDVIFYMHGGAFMYGAGQVNTPDYILAEQNIVYISINYRLGPFGFLSTEDDVIPGNNGLKDQVMALKWVQENIERFGGDSSRITIAGLSAGGASVHLHYLSPMSRDLFSQGISLSGSALCPWVLTENSRMKAHILASSVGCPINDSSQLLDCLKRISARKLLLRTEELFLPWHYNPFTPFGPVVEQSGEGAFLSEHPYQLLTEGRIKDAPWLASVTTEEGLFPAATFVTDEELMQDLNDNWESIAPHLLDYNHTVQPHRLSEVSRKIRQFYLGNGKITKENHRRLVKMISDRLFVADTERAVRLHASNSKSPVYFYTFGYKGKYNFSELFCKCKDDLGVSHGDDLIYLLKTGVLGASPLETQDDREMTETMVNIWASFASSGVPSAPSHEWPPVPMDGESLNYLLITSTKHIKMLSSSNLGNSNFWGKLPMAELWKSNGNNLRFDDEL